MAKAHKLRLLMGKSYTYGKYVFTRGKCLSVDDDAFYYLVNLVVRRKPRFLDTTDGLPSARVIIKKPDHTKEDEPKEETVPTFRSKLELAEFALKTHGFKFEGDLKDLKMKDMVVSLSEHIVSKDRELSNEKTLAV